MFRKILVIALGIAFLGGFAASQADDELVLRVDTNGFADISIGATTLGAVAPFHVSGDICEELDLLDPCTPIGKFHCWGWFLNPEGTSAVVSQEYDIFDRGKIQVQGIEDAGPRAVVGGTRDFRRVRGQATGFEFSALGDQFIATFELERVRDDDDDDDDDDSDSDSDDDD